MNTQDKKVQKTLETIEKEKLENNNPCWIITRDTGEFLNKLIRDNNFRKVLEIGTSIGYSGIWMAEALSHTGGKLYTVESHNGRFKTAEQNISNAGLTAYVQQLKGHAPDVPIPDMFDLLFLDATKVEYVSYIKAFLFHMKKGGIIIADNALTHEKELSAYKEYIFNSPQLESKLIKIGNGLFYSRIK
jgi:predicted O-methyltransferase YrrM